MQRYVVIIRTCLITLPLLGVVSTALAQAPASDEAAQARAAATERERARQAALPDTPGTGPFPALKEEVSSLPDHVIYRPADLKALGATRLGIYLFGNGACTNDGASARLHLLEVASHGYLAIAPGRIRSGPGATAAPTPIRPPEGEPPRYPPSPTSHTDLLDALDWALARNADPASPYAGRIDATAIAVAGFSCGGLQALQISGDSRIRTTIVMNSGIYNVTPSRITGMELSKDLLKTLHRPTLYLLGGPTDIAYENGMDDFARIDHVPVMVGNLDVGHGGTYWEPNGGRAAAASVAWLNWQLRGDRDAARMFVGKDCGLCTDAAWTVAKKGID